MTETRRRTDLNFAEFRKLLTEEQARLRALDQDQHADILAESRDASENELSTYSTFDPAENEDTAAVLADRDRDKAQNMEVEATLHQIEAALARLDAGTFGLDEITGESIPIARLRAIPWTTMTVETAERHQL